MKLSSLLTFATIASSNLKIISGLNTFLETGAECPGQLKVHVGQLNFPPHLPYRTSKIWILFYAKSLVGTENTANEYQTKMWAGEFSVQTKENYPDFFQQDKFQNKLMSNPAYVCVSVVGVENPRSGAERGAGSSGPVQRLH